MYRDRRFERQIKNIVWTIYALSAIAIALSIMAVLAALSLI
jgi:hypothetical protein